MALFRSICIFQWLNNIDIIKYWFSIRWLLIHLEEKFEADTIDFMESPTSP